LSKIEITNLRLDVILLDTLL